MKFIKSKKGLALLATLAVVGVAAFGAYAYFTNSGSSTDTAAVSVGQSGAAWDVNFLTAADGSTAIATSYAEPNAGVGACTNTDPGTETNLLPTDPASCNAVVATVPFTITNMSEAAEQIHSYSVSIDPTWAATNGPSATTDTAAGCAADDFKIGTAAAGATYTKSGLNDTLAPNSDGNPTDAHSYSVTVEMVDTGFNQDGCQGLTPDLLVSATS